MLNQEVEERLAERLVNRIEDVNAFILKKIGEAIKEISTLSPSQAYKVSQILKYGGSYEEIAKELAKVSGKNVKEIYEIFDEVAKNNKQFAKEFYRYRGIDYIPFKDDLALQNQVRSIATLTANTFINIANTSAVGLIQDGKFKQLKQAYEEVIDKAIISVAQGKDNFYSAMRDTLKELGSNGVVQYESGYTRRLDSAVRMNILDGIRHLNNENSKRFGAEYGADGVEISVHSNPAPDHADIQGRQFSNEEYDKLESGHIAKDYKGNKYDGHDKRQISTYNCYHKIFAIVLGVSEPEYSDEELKKIQDENEKGFDFEGKHYTNYEGTQLQRKLETEIRRQKDTQILANASGDMELVKESQSKITKLTHKYNDLCKVSGLKPKKQRMSVSGYKRIDVKKIKEPQQFKSITENKDYDFNEAFSLLSRDLEDKNVVVGQGFYRLGNKLSIKNLEQLNYLTDKYPHNIVFNNNLGLETFTGRRERGTYGRAFYDNPRQIKLEVGYLQDRDKLLKNYQNDIDKGWHYKTRDIDTSVITHEYGHIIEFNYLKRLQNRANTTIDFKGWDKDLEDTIITNAIRKLDKKISKAEFKNKYYSRYAKSKRNYEWFAEAFTKLELGEKDVLTEALEEWLNDFYK